MSLLSIKPSKVFIVITEGKIKIDLLSFSFLIILKTHQKIALLGKLLMMILRILRKEVALHNSTIY